MRPITRILSPVDFTEPARAALERALFLAKGLGAWTDVLHVCRPVPEVHSPILGWSDTPVLHMMQEYSAESRLAELLESFESELVTHATPHVAHGAVVPTILEHARRLQSDLIVVGTHARTGLGHLLLGSHADGVLRRAPCPVLSVRSSTHRSMEPRRILVAVGPTKAAPNTMDLAISLAKRFAATVDLLCVLDDADRSEFDESERTPDTTDRGRDHAEEQIRELAAGARVRGVHVEEVLIDEGDPARCIAEWAEVTGADLVVVTGDGHRAWTRALRGSPTERLMRHSSAPILTVPGAAA